MGVQAGFYFFDGRPVEEAGRELVADLQALSPDGVTVTAVSDSGVLLARGACHTWVGERGSQDPRRSSSGLVMTWDGRLDNRDDLRLQLGYSLANDASDAEIALTVFERHGIVGLKLLVGDWSLVVWDSRRRMLSLARDYMGVRPLYYCRDGLSLMWSSSLGELAMRAGRVNALNEEFVARFMTLQFSTDVTPYDGIRAVPTATCVSISADGAETRETFWRLEPGLVRYRDRRMYEERLRELWRDAVGSRLRAEGTVWAELSGGLDSSSVVCMADALIKDRSVHAVAVQPLSHVTLETPEGDERRFIAEVEAQIGVSSVILGVEIHQDLRTSAAGWVTPLAPRGVHVAAEREVRRRGGHVILSGRMGDLIMGCISDNSVSVFDDIADWRLRTALSKSRLWSRACRKPFVEIARGLAEEWLRAVVYGEWSVLNQAHPAGLRLIPSRLRELAQASAGRPGRVPRVPLAKRGLAESIVRYSSQARLEPRNSAAGVTYTYPFADRSLVEFMLAIPGEELSAPGGSRFLMRRAFKELVPDRVLQRASKGYYPPAAMRAIRPRLQALRRVELLEVVRRGWIDPSELDVTIRHLEAGRNQACGEISLVLRLEEWLSARNRQAPAGISTRKEVKTHAVFNA